MKKPKFNVTRSIAEYFADRRTFLGKAGTVSLGAVLAALGAPDAARAYAAVPFADVPPPTNFSTLLGLCTPGTGITTYTPGVTNTLQAIHAGDAVTFSPCAVAQNKTITAMNDGFDSIESCSGRSDFGGGGEIVYTAGQNSSWTLDSFTGSRLLGQQVGVVSGLITNGPFNGARLWKFCIRTVNDPSTCASASGLTSRTGQNTLIIAQ